MVIPLKTPYKLGKPKPITIKPTKNMAYKIKGQGATGELF